MAESRDNPVVAENRKPGTLSWLPRRLSFAPMTKHGQNLGTYSQNYLGSGRSSRIEGWCSHATAKAGDSLQVFVSTNPAGAFTLDLYRMGYYQGNGARHVMSVGSISATTQSDPIPGPERLIQCAWKPSHEFTIPADWLSGVYLGKLTRADDGTESYIVFVLRDEREAEVIVQTSDFTWQAYNGWPNWYSLYSNGVDLVLYYWNDVAVSFDRPYQPGHFTTVIPGAGEYFVFEFPFTYWLESMGYDVTYCSNLDTHLGTAGTARAAAFLSIGHDEYWTVQMHHNLRAAIDAGLSVGFFSGNTSAAAIGLRPGASGRPDRVFSRVDRFGEKRILESYPATHWVGAGYRAYPVAGEAPDEGSLMGARNDAPWSGCAHWACTLPDHWIFEGTGMVKGDAIPNLVGHEWLGLPAEDIKGLEVVSRGTTYDKAVGLGEYTATVYPGPKGNVVFTASTCWWSTGLALPPGFERPTWQGVPSALPDGRVQRITSNVLSRMISARRA